MLCLLWHVVLRRFPGTHDVTCLVVTWLARRQSCVVEEVVWKPCRRQFTFSSVTVSTGISVCRLFSSYRQSCITIFSRQVGISDVLDTHMGECPVNYLLHFYNSFYAFHFFYASIAVFILFVCVIIIASFFSWLVCYCCLLYLPVVAKCRTFFCRMCILLCILYAQKITCFGGNTFSKSCKLM